MGLLRIMTSAPASANHDSADSGDAYCLGKGALQGTHGEASIQVDWTGIVGGVDATVAVWVSNTGVRYKPKTSNGSPLVIAVDSLGTGAAIVSLNGVVTEQFVKLVYDKGAVSAGTIDAYIYTK